MKRLLLAAALCAGCEIPVGPTGPLTEKEQAAVAFAACHSEFKGLSTIGVNFHDGPRGDGALAWACEGRRINLVRSWVNGTDLVSLEMVVAHEVCHCADPRLLDGHYEGDEYVFGTVDFCAQISYREAGCHE